jgi:HK97 family phage portal protein
VAPNEAQFIETMQHQVEEVCRWFGVPPHKVMHLLRATFGNIEHQSIEVVVDSVMPWVKTFEEEADCKLFGSNRLGFYTRMNLSGLLRGDSAARAAFYKAMREMGVYSANDILALEDRNKIGPEGDKRIVPANMTTLERVGEAPAPVAAPRPPAADPQPPAAEPPAAAALLH